MEVMSMGGDVFLNRSFRPAGKRQLQQRQNPIRGDFGGEGEYDFTSHTGDIEAIAPAYASIDVSGPLESGPSRERLLPRAETHVPSTAKAGVPCRHHGKAASSVKLFSFSGKIHLKKRQKLVFVGALFATND